jgi:NAD(P) transhydrogenase subunit alpha
MYVNVAVLKETSPHERRVALVPAVVPRLIKLGAKLHMETGAGASVQLRDSDYRDVVFVADRVTLLADADLVLGVQPPPVEVIDAMKPGAVLICFVYAGLHASLIERLLARKITCFAMEMLPRITRAQSMDALSSQSALAGYYAVQLGATTLGRVLPKITTETQEQALSLGATFVQTGVDATGKGGYARALTADEQTKVAGALTEHIQSADLIITTAAIPGRPSPKLISAAQVAGMKAGAVIVDLSAEGGGNCVDTKPGETVTVGLVTIVAPLNVPSMLGEDASALYSKNQYNLLLLMMKDNIITIDWSDEILAKTVLTHDGRLKNQPVAKAA